MSRHRSTEPRGGRLRRFLTGVGEVLLDAAGEGLFILVGLVVFGAAVAAGRAGRDRAPVVTVAVGVALGALVAWGGWLVVRGSVRRPGHWVAVVTTALAVTAIYGVVVVGV